MKDLLRSYLLHLTHDTYSVYVGLRIPYSTVPTILRRYYTQRHSILRKINTDITDEMFVNSYGFSGDIGSIKYLQKCTLEQAKKIADEYKHCMYMDGVIAINELIENPVAFNHFYDIINQGIMASVIINVPLESLEWDSYTKIVDLHSYLISNEHPLEVSRKVYNFGLGG